MFRAPDIVSARGTSCGVGGALSWRSTSAGGSGPVAPGGACWAPPPEGAADCVAADDTLSALTASPSAAVAPAPAVFSVVSVTTVSVTSWVTELLSSPHWVPASM